MSATTSFEVATDPRSDTTETVDAEIKDSEQHDYQVVLLGRETGRTVRVDVEGPKTSPTAHPVSSLPDWAEPLLRDIGIHEIQR